MLTQALASIQAAEDERTLDAVRVHYLGKKGLLTLQLKDISTQPVDQRKALGQALNAVRVQIQSALETRKQLLAEAALAQSLEQDKIDVSLPGRHAHAPGHPHPVMKVKRRIEQILGNLGFETVTGPEIEDDFHNFTALNIPLWHPARAMHDTFYLEDKARLLRTHTSSVQIRSAKKRDGAFRIASLGRVYRKDSDSTHTPMFHQCEGLVVHEKASFAELKGVLIALLEGFFEQTLVTRFRPSYFPFTEPSAEVDIQCVNCQGKGCRVCSQSGWLEVLGCGMVHPNVLKNMDIDPEAYSAYAFGIGLDRLAMLMYQAQDLRAFFSGDLSFLEQCT